MAGLRTCERIQDVIGKCGHLVGALIPPHAWGGRIGPKGVANIAKAKLETCIDCRKRPPSHRPGV